MGFINLFKANLCKSEANVASNNASFRLETIYQLTHLHAE